MIYVMMGLKNLATKHSIENSLYHSDAINIVYGLLGDYRVTKWLDCVYDRDLSEKETWSKLIASLGKMLTVQQESL